MERPAKHIAAAMESACVRSSEEPVRPMTSVGGIMKWGGDLTEQELWPLCSFLSQMRPRVDL